MSLAPPPYYFRLRENGAAVFRIADDARNARLEMEQIAVVNTRSGEVKPQGGRELSDADRAAIADWLASRQARVAAREAARVDDLVEALNGAAQWAQTRAGAEELAAATPGLLMAMHDLRSVLIRKAGRETDS